MFLRRQFSIGWSSLIVGCLALVPSASRAADDYVIQIPDGWISDVDAPHASSPDANAIVAWYSEDGRIVRSMIIQADLDGTEYTNVFDGKIGWLEYAPDGSSLLAHRFDSHALGARLTEKILFDNEGYELWSWIDGRSFQFSTTGEVLLAWRVQGQCRSSPTKETEIFDLDLTSLKVVSKDPAPTDVLVIGAGDRVLFSTDTTLLCLDTSGGPPKTLWTVVKPQEPEYRLFSSMEMLDDDHLAWHGTGGRIAVIDIDDGRLVYDYDPVALAEKDSQVDAEHNRYFRYRLSRGPKPGTLTLFDGTSEALILDLKSGKLSSETIDVSLPGEQFELGRWELPEQRLFLISPREVRVRSIR